MESQVQIIQQYINTLRQEKRLLAVTPEQVGSIMQLLLNLFDADEEQRQQILLQMQSILQNVLQSQQYIEQMQVSVQQKIDEWQEIIQTFDPATYFSGITINIRKDALSITDIIRHPDSYSLDLEDVKPGVKICFRSLLSHRWETWRFAPPLPGVDSDVPVTDARLPALRVDPTNYYPVDP